MASNSLIGFSAAFCSGALAVGAILLGGRSISLWLFVAGMALMAVESVLSGMSVNALSPEEVVGWQSLALLVKSFLPGIWLAFSLTYSRGNPRDFLTQWRFLLATAFLLPVGLWIVFRTNLFHILPLPEPAVGWWIRFEGAAKVLNVLQMIADVLILMNLEGTFRSAVGTMRWRIKFVIIGLAVLFGARIYTRSQALLFSGYDLSLTTVDAGALCVGCILIAVAYLRRGFADIDVYPSRAVLQSSITVFLAGGYLLGVGVLAQVVARLGGARDFQTQAFVVLLGVALLAVLLLSDRVRQKLRNFVSRHFRRPEHDFRQAWARFTRELSNMVTAPKLCTVAAKAVSETFDVLSVTIWLVDQQKERLILGASTSQLSRDVALSQDVAASGLILNGGLRRQCEPFDLETVQGDWADVLKEVNPVQFQNGGHRIGIPLVAGERCLGFAILADRVNGLPYSVEEMDLMKCIGDQIAAGLLNLRLTDELMVGKELEAFQTMSAFFVHDLKNAASTLSLMLQNLPVHFGDPAFREDALRGIAATVGRINHLIERLSVLRNRLDIRPIESDLNQLVGEALKSLHGMPGVEFVQELNPLPQILADPELLRSVVTNLLLNAGDAVGGGGRIKVETGQGEGRAFISVSDNGCGMSAAFVRNSLFRPFQTTKKKGLGIGMFQSKMIVEAHRGIIEVDTESGKGTTFRVILPLPSHGP